MKSEPYAQSKNDELTLRYHLAVDRTVLANERTLPSYVYTALALAASGAALIHFSRCCICRGGWMVVNRSGCVKLADG